MKKEELKAIRDWCECLIVLRNKENMMLKQPPEGFTSIYIHNYHYGIQVYSGIEKIAHAMKATLRIDKYSKDMYQKWIYVSRKNGTQWIKFFQLEPYLAEDR